MQITTFDEYIEINKQYKLYQDGTIYNTLNDDDIPQWIFKFRDFVLKNQKQMTQ